MFVLLRFENQKKWLSHWVESVIIREGDRINVHDPERYLDVEVELRDGQIYHAEDVLDLECV